MYVSQTLSGKLSSQEESVANLKARLRQGAAEPVEATVYSL
jgi:hypothetical protein